ncbi:MAG: isocitrate lyase/phosphoenolpyruvate mutase family protein [Chromatiales bacterium]|nr:isocitrate lyase/phosphoenolpyruvate mutase family protein [Chromatiales bacterium]
MSEDIATDHIAALRRLLAGPRAFIAPGCYDAFTALLIEQAGFACAYLSGASVAFSRLGRPDIGLTSLDDVAQAVLNIRERIALPLIVDADTGFGNALNVQRTVRLLERMGASAIQLEDQASPKRCGHLEGKQLVPVPEMLGKLRAARDACRRDDLVIVARTDAVAVEGLAAGLDRAEAYLEAGADVLFIEALQSRAQLAEAGSRLGSRAPLLANMVEGGRTPLLAVHELSALGFRMVIHPGAMLRVLGFAGGRYLAHLREHGTTLGMLDRMLDFDGINARVGTTELLARGRRYE